jgi:hypothetical protein
MPVLFVYFALLFLITNIKLQAHEDIHKKKLEKKCKKKDLNNMKAVHALV